MEKDNVELIKLAIQNLVEEKNQASGDSLVDNEEDQLFLSRLLSQLESMKEDNTSKMPETLAEAKQTPPSAVVETEAKDETGDGSDGGRKEMGTDEIVKELRKVKRQNTITHWLLSIMIILTATWQLSEVSLVLKVKNKLSNPFRSVRSLIKDAIKVSGANVPNGAEMSEPIVPLPTLNIPPLPLPHVDLAALSLDSGED